MQQLPRQCKAGQAVWTSPNVADDHVCMQLCRLFGIVPTLSQKPAVAGTPASAIPWFLTEY